MGIAEQVCGAVAHAHLLHTHIPDWLSGATQEKNCLSQLLISCCGPPVSLGSRLRVGHCLVTRQAQRQCMSVCLSVSLQVLLLCFCCFLFHCIYVTRAGQESFNSNFLLQVSDAHLFQEWHRYRKKEMTLHAEGLVVILSLPKKKKKKIRKFTLTDLQVDYT